MHITNRDLIIQTTDNTELAVTLYEPETMNDRFVLINSAMGVKRGYYTKYATFLAGEGFTVLTYDYRGVGESRPESLKGYRATLLDWGAKDQDSVIGWIKDNYAGHRLLVIGHSVGGQIVGLTPQNTHIAGVIGVGAQSGYWWLWPGLLKLRMLVLWYMVIPIIAPISGYFPASKFGLGEDIPSGVALEWARAGRRRKYILDLFGRGGHDHFAGLSAPFVSYSFSDDSYSPYATVDALLTFYPNATPTHKHIRPADIGASSIGHFGFFRQMFANTLWAKSADWLRQV